MQDIISSFLDISTAQCRIDEYIKAVRDIDPTMQDEEIIQIAALEKRMVVTMDKDFGELVYHSLFF